MLDENALIREYNSKMYSFAYRSTEGLHFEWIENEKDTLEITHRSYPHILEQFERARQDILQEKINSKIAANVNDDDILSVI